MSLTGGQPWEIFYIIVDGGGVDFQDRASLCSPGCPGIHSVD